MPTAHGPLAGIRVADLSTVLAGPFATMLLADLGAEVVKVEPPGGDATRGWGPPWVGDGEARTAAYFLAANRNKRSIRVDLRTDGGRDVLRRLLVRSDVLVENARPGGLARLGFDDDAIARLNPALVHLAISGYGPDGPDADRPGYDFVVQAESGLMSITGATDADGGRPTKVGVAIADVVTGLYAAVGIVSALLARERDAAPGGRPDAAPGGRPGATPDGRPGATPDGRPDARPGGQRVDVSLIGAALAALVNQAQNAFATGLPPRRLGNAHPNIVPYETFATADGEIAVAVGSERQWPRFCDALGLTELTRDPRFATNGDRVAHRDELRPLLAARLAERSSAAWLEALRRADVPAGAIHDVVAAFEAPSVVERGLTVDLEHPALGTIRQVRSPLELSATPASVRTPPPLPGEQTDEILAELGLDPAAIAALRDAGAVA